MESKDQNNRRRMYFQKENRVQHPGGKDGLQKVFNSKKFGHSMDPERSKQVLVHRKEKRV